MEPMTIMLPSPMARGETFRIRVEDGPITVEGTPEPCTLRQGELAAFVVRVDEFVDEEKTIRVARWERVEV